MGRVKKEQGGAWGREVGPWVQLSDRPSQPLSITLLQSFDFLHGSDSSQSVALARDSGSIPDS